MALTKQTVPDARASRPWEVPSPEEELKAAAEMAQELEDELANLRAITDGFVLGRIARCVAWSRVIRARIQAARAEMAAGELE